MMGFDGTVSVSHIPWKTHIISYYRQMINRNTHVSISYVPRECNKVAHAMAAITSKEHLSLRTPFHQKISSIQVMNNCNEVG